MRARRGSNLIEVLVATSIAGVVLLALGGFIASTFRAAGSDQDRVFATQKALQMVEELSAYRSSGADGGLEGFANGPQFLLTTAKEAIPEDALSGNPRVEGRYKYVRRVTVEPVPGDEFARKITVEVFYAAKDRNPRIPNGARPLAAISNVVRSSTARVGPRQILDVWALSIENLPHVMRKADGTQFAPSASDARRFFEGALRNLEAKNPWLGFRIHYVSRLSVGRDPHYRPYVNDGQPLAGGERDALDRVYWYPGKLQEGADSARYFDPLRMGGRFALGGVTGAAGAVAKGTYAPTDQYNHAVRHAEEFDAAGKPVLPEGQAEPSLRQLLELLQAGDGRMRNALVVNLHGELLPVVPLRNYADAAQDPTEEDPQAARRRLVTHPYKLAFEVKQEPVRLFVHPYMADGGDTPAATGNDRHVKLADAFPAHARAGRVVVKGLKPLLARRDGATGAASPADVTVRVVQRERISNGNCPSCDEAGYVVKTSWPADLADEPDAGRKNHSGPHVGQAGAPAPTFEGDDLVIELRDLDYDAHQTLAGGTAYGIPAGDAGAKLHGLQYFPDPLLPFLTTPVAGVRPRNTARAVIEFKLRDAAEHQRLEVVTQLAGPGGAFPDLAPGAPRSSRTWLYGAAAGDWDPARKLYWDVAKDRPAIPWTDQVQLVGDPRHNPYLDMRQAGTYNTAFADLTAGKQAYKGITSTGLDLSKYLEATNPFAGALPIVGGAFEAAFKGTTDGWAGTRVDAPAYFRLWREALLASDAVFVNASGRPLAMIGLGGEFALDQPVGAGGAVHVSKKPYDGTTGETKDEADELTGDRRAWIARDGGDGWYAKPWLGELHPPDQREAWVTTGNLPAGAFRRRAQHGLDGWPVGTDDATARDRRALDGRFGLASFLNAVADGALTPPEVTKDGKRARVTSAGEAAGDALHMALMPSLAADAGLRKDGGEAPPEWGRAPYLTRLGFEWLDKPYDPVAYYDLDGAEGVWASSPLWIKEKDADRRAIVLANTLRPDAPTQLLATMEAAAVGGVAAFFDGTRQDLGGHNMKPLPRVKIKEPTSGASTTLVDVPLRWFARAVRGSGKPYSPRFDYPMATRPQDGGPLDVVYFVKYRNQTENGPWTVAKTAGRVDVAGGVPALEGEPVAHPDVKPIPNLPAYPEPVTCTWKTDGLPAGQYLLRVEAYRVGEKGLIPTHLAYHEIPVTLVR